VSDGRASVNRVCEICGLTLDGQTVPWGGGLAHDACAKTELAYAEMMEKDERDD
jgi:hypothetical protein